MVGGKVAGEGVGVGAGVGVGVEYALTISGRLCCDWLEPGSITLVEQTQVAGIPGIAHPAAGYPRGVALPDAIQDRGPAGGIVRSQTLVSCRGQPGLGEGAKVYEACTRESRNAGSGFRSVPTESRDAA